MPVHKILFLFLYFRLEAYDRNSNFGKPDDVAGPDYKMSLPDVTLYSDIHSEKKLPGITLTRINSYLFAFDKELDENAISLYKEKYLVYIRSSSNDLFTYIKSSCRAQMRKSVTYDVDISIASDGHIHEAQCECAAGMGPNAHCKHVCAVLFACTEFIKKKTCVSRANLYRKVANVPPRKEVHRFSSEVG